MSGSEKKEEKEKADVSKQSTQLPTKKEGINEILARIKKQRDEMAKLEQSIEQDYSIIKNAYPNHVTQLKAKRDKVVSDIAKLQEQINTLEKQKADITSELIELGEEAVKHKREGKGGKRAKIDPVRLKTLVDRIRASNKDATWEQIAEMVSKELGESVSRTTCWKLYQ